MMGIYSSDIILPVAPPILLPRLGVVVLVLSDIDDRPERITITITTPPDKTEVARVEADVKNLLVQSPEDSKHMVLRCIVGLGPLPLTADGFMEVMVATERESFRAGRLMVRFAPPPQPAVAPAAEGTQS